MRKALKYKSQEGLIVPCEWVTVFFKWEETAYEELNILSLSSLKKTIYSIVLDEFLYGSTDPDIFYKRLSERYKNLINSMENLSFIPLASFIPALVVCSYNNWGIRIISCGNDTLSIKIGDKDLRENKKDIIWNELPLRTVISIKDERNKTELEVTELPLPEIEEKLVKKKYYALSKDLLADNQSLKANILRKYFVARIINTCRGFSQVSDCINELYPEAITLNISMDNCLITIYDKYIKSENYPELMPSKLFIINVIWHLYFKWLLAIHRRDLWRNTFRSIELKGWVLYRLSQEADRIDVRRIISNSIEEWKIILNNFLLEENGAFPLGQFSESLTNPFVHQTSLSIIKNLSCEMKKEGLIWVGESRNKPVRFKAGNRDSLGEYKLTYLSGKIKSSAGFFCSLKNLIERFVIWIGNK